LDDPSQLLVSFSFSVKLGDAYGLYFFEPRYRYMIAEDMKYQPVEAKCGGRVMGDSAVFIHANRGPLAPSTPATLVQVKQCEISPDGHANVELAPVAYAWLEKVWTHPNSGSLAYAQSFKMGQKATHAMHQLARQEQLGNAMSNLPDHLVREGGNGSSSSGISSGDE
jgi:hypothetical protein